MPPESFAPLVEPESLSSTLDALVEIEFHGLVLDPAVRSDAAVWLASRIGHPRSYSGMPAPTDRDFSEGARVFTGERLVSRAATAHVLGEEACRALARLDADEETLGRAQAEMTERFTALVARDPFDGRFCCALCTAAVWRHASTGRFPAGESLVPEGLRYLRSVRDGKGRWNRFPFWYTLLALSDFDPADTRPELLYAAPALERVLRRRPGEGPFESRRRKLAKRVLAAV